MVLAVVVLWSRAMFCRLRQQALKIPSAPTPTFSSTCVCPIFVYKELYWSNFLQVKQDKPKLSSSCPDIFCCIIGRQSESEQTHKFGSGSSQISSTSGGSGSAKPLPTANGSLPFLTMIFLLPADPCLSLLISLPADPGN